ncbi:MAG: aminotransferase class I/II-fold pyridoxal phosphate-dependent enzyme [Desulfatibacillaceae bacterium]|nr:aminotransferase class I/II-fold pyridoxal phosphate-dependent enzyme [Desulfatibacillaceae bacterium]
MNPIASQLNQVIETKNPFVLETLSQVGKNLFFPKGILAQSAEAKQKAHKFNATIGIATEKGQAMHLKSIMSFINNLSPGECLTYAPSFGLPELRAAWKESIYKKNPSLAGKSISLPIVSQAITHGISVVGDVWFDPGDVLVLPDKMWGNYNLVLGVRRGVKVVNFPLFTPGGAYNVAGFEETVKRLAGQHPKVSVLLNFPQNPTGYTASEKEAQAIADILIRTAQAGTRVLAICDDAYFGLFFDETCAKESLFAKLCNADKRLMAVKLDGATKEDFVWGLRIGFITYGTGVDGDPAPLWDALERKTAGAVRGSISNASHLSQRILAKAMSLPEYEMEKAQKRDILKARALKVKQVLQDSKYADAWEPYPFNSGYFMCLNLKTVDAEALRVHLLDNYGVGLIALSKTDLRVAFSCLEEEDTQELFDIVLKGVRDLENK